MFIKYVVCLLILVVLILCISRPATAGNNAIQTLMVSVQVLDKRSAHKAAMRITPGITSIKPYMRVKETKIFAEYSINHSITIEGGKNITITGKLENPLQNGDTLFIRSTASGEWSQDNILLTTSEQDLMASTPKVAEGSISNTYPFHYSLNTEGNAFGEIQLKRPIIVVLAVYY